LKGIAATELEDGKSPTADGALWKNRSSASNFQGGKRWWQSLEHLLLVGFVGPTAAPSVSLRE